MPKRVDQDQNADPLQVRYNSACHEAHLSTDLNCSLNVLYDCARYFLGVLPMNTRTILIIVVAAVIIAVAGYYYYSGNMGSEETTPTVTSPATETQPAAPAN
jgi:hypothetical protein